MICVQNNCLDVLVSLNLGFIKFKFDLFINQRNKLTLYILDAIV